MKFTKFKTQRVALILCSGALALLCSSVFADSTIVVTPINMDGWGFYSTDSSGALNTGSNTGQMVFGPAGQPAGSGSANFIVPDGTQSEQLRGGSSFDGTLVSALTSLTYSTYATSWNGSQLPYLQLYVNDAGTGTTADQRVVFEPTYSSATAGNGNPNAPQGPVAQNTWQTWNALDGMWYTTSGVPNANVGGGANGPGSHAITWSEFLNAFPNATIVDSATGVGGIRFTSGFASGPFNTNLDDFTIGVNGVNTTFDFEPVPEASTWAAAGLAAAMLIVQLVRAQAFSKRAALAHGKGKR